ncbi:MAG: DNA replication and repair protein RecF [Aminobacterium sp.]|uniref:DNA replication/repair protein RecF n=1 Tax=Aminobacterium sp. TaxID=1872491 RepID=UPI002B1F415D|nr:DNA replication and repair protein RecF [Aminobacterium sp.]MEA4877083.1 DNA replication and repair protein RecF [Aminobacterium sp.]
MTSWHNFRNLTPRRLEWAAGLNLLIGNNGSGKTNALEALHFLSGWGPFRSQRKSVLVNWNIEEKQAFLRGFFSGEGDIDIVATVGEKNVIQCDGKRTTYGTIRSNIPTLAFLPGDLAIVDGAPSVRRQFLDRLCALLFPLYVRKMSDCRKTLRHRAILLKERKDPSLTSKVLAPLVSWIWSTRAAAVDLLNIGIKEFYALLPAEIELTFQRGGAFDLQDPLEDYWRSVKKWRDKERITTVPQVGPQRDDMIITSKGQPVTMTMSRGQRRRTAASLMLAAGWAVERKMRRKPILILDEIAAELDDYGRQLLIETLIQSSWQVFAATAESSMGHWPGAIWNVHQGDIERKNS